MPSPGRPPHPSPEPDHAGTLVESEEKIRQAIAGLNGRPPLPAVAAEPPPRIASSKDAASGPHKPTTGGRLFRPTLRPPTLALTIFDDGKHEGEVIRIRSPRFVIGRTEGDLTIPIDGRISSRHVEIALHPMAGGGPGQWVVTDLDSRHGLFVRVTRAVLGDRSEFLVGGGRYLFREPAPDVAHQASGQVPGQDFSKTQPWGGGSESHVVPTLIELASEREAGRTLLTKSEYWIGSSASCAIARADDPFCEPRHARVFRKASDGWRVEHDRTLNGLWLRTTRIPVDAAVRFQIGEQRFQLKVL